MRFLAFATAALVAFPFATAAEAPEAPEIYDPEVWPNNIEKIQDTIVEHKIPSEHPLYFVKYKSPKTPRLIPKQSENENPSYKLGRFQRPPQVEKANPKEQPQIEKIQYLKSPKIEKAKPQEQAQIEKFKYLTPTKIEKAKQQKHDPFKHQKLCHKHDHLKPCHKHDHHKHGHKHDHHKPCHKHDHHKHGHKHDHHKIHYLQDHHDLGRKHGHDKNKHEIYYKHQQEKKKKHKDLTAKCICERLHRLAHKADRLFDHVKDIKCGNGDRDCWEPVRKGLYEIEWELDLFDRAIDKSNLNKCFSEQEEADIARCFCRYAEALIRLLDEISRKLEHIEGKTAYFIVTAVNSLRAADYAFVYELGRRLQREKYQIEIFRKEGATDGSTPHSIRKAFALFVSTPYITGEDFRVEDYQKEPKEKELKIIEEIKNKHKHKGHHHPHHHKGHHHHDKHCHHHRPHHKDHDHHRYYHKDLDHHRHHHKDHARHCPHRKDHDDHRHHHKDHAHFHEYHKGHDDKDREKEKVRIKVEDHDNRAQ
ncbi:unnamed protein product [Clonostachys solani]|uniref:Histidine-rich glycoprotein n=1 Tax=Clonostachys solani TaxID=160281 RepID=A0A9N9ZDT0_9HYPO|nr:unnamed protein product [Clonostachys solani]